MPTIPGDRAVVLPGRLRVRTRGARVCPVYGPPPPSTAVRSSPPPGPSAPPPGWGSPSASARTGRRRPPPSPPARPRPRPSRSMPPPSPVRRTPGGPRSPACPPRAAADGYRRLADGPAWNRVVRADLATAHGGRAERRTALASFVQFTDLHLVDVQSPLRYEYLRAETASAWRPQEALSVAGVISLIERVNALPGGPATGAPLSFVMTTGDNTDNNSKLELEWFLTAMSGGRITPNSGDPRRYEGVQDSGLKLYWQPDSALRDADKQQGFPRLDGFLEAAIRTVHSPGLRLPWYSTVGNHDSLPGGCYAPGDPFWTDTRHRRPQAGDAARRRGREGLEGGQGRPRPQGRGLQAAADLTRQAVQEGHPRRAARPLHPGRVSARPPRPGAHRPRPARPRLHLRASRREPPLLHLPGLRRRPRDQPGHHRPRRPLHRLGR